MKPVLEASQDGEVRISDVVDKLADDFNLTEEERETLLPSGKQTTFSNRVHWAKTYLVKAGLVDVTKRAHFIISDRGRQVLANDNVVINNNFLKQFDEFQEFRSRSGSDETEVDTEESTSSVTPDEALRVAYKKINASLSSEILMKVRKVTPLFFEQLIVDLLLAMGYGGTHEDAGRALGKTGDNGVDGVIDQDPLGVDQIYVQAKRYAEGNSIGSGDIRDFFGALNLKKAQKGIFITTSDFTSSAVQTAGDLGSRIVLINGTELARLMIRYNIGARDEQVLYIRKIDEDYFEEGLE
jgi:restriction system protein